jgi:hypothetical protein
MYNIESVSPDVFIERINSIRSKLYADDASPGEKRILMDRLCLWRSALARTLLHRAGNDSDTEADEIRPR